MMEKHGSDRYFNEKITLTDDTQIYQGEYRMKHNLMLTIASLLSIVFFTLHLTDDIVRGMSPGGVQNLIGVLILVTWLYGTLALAERRSGYIIMLLGSLLGAGVPILHMTGAGLIGGKIANSGGVFFWVWTLIVLQVTATFSFILSVRGLWSQEWRKAGQSNDLN